MQPLQLRRGMGPDKVGTEEDVVQLAGEPGRGAGGAVARAEQERRVRDVGG